MLLVALVLVALLSVYFWRQVVTLVLVAVVVLVVVGAASVMHDVGPERPPGVDARRA